MRKKIELTQRGLLRRLHRLGYGDVTDRRITDWKNKGLLPHYDCRGSGLGKGKGKAKSSWADGRAIIERAVWVYRLMAIYRSSESAYLPLWVLGYPVPKELVRGALLEPLENIAEMFEVEAVGTLEVVEPYERKDGIIEDYIGDLSHDWIRKEKFTEILGIPQEVIEATMNIFFNPEYDLKDLGFEEGNQQLAVWKNRVNTEIMPALAKGLEEENSQNIPPVRPDGIEILFSQPAFFQEHLSVEALSKVVTNASEEDFRDVQEDLQILRTIIEPMGEMIATLMKHTGIGRLPTLDEVLPDLFRLANLLVLVDLSMRKRGLGPQIDYVKMEAAKKVQEDFSQVTEEALASIGPDIADAFKKGFKKLRKNWTALVAAKERISQVG